MAGTEVGPEDGDVEVAFGDCYDVLEFFCGFEDAMGVRLCWFWVGPEGFEVERAD